MGLVSETNLRIALNRSLNALCGASVSEKTSSVMLLAEERGN